MASRRSRGEGTLFWNEARAVDRGPRPSVSLRTGSVGARHVSAKTKTEAKAKLLELRRDQIDGLRPLSSAGTRSGKLWSRGWSSASA